MPGQARKKFRLSIDPEAAEEWNRILEFYARRNQSDVYSKKLDARLDTVLAIICTQPELGQITTQKDIRRRTFENYAVFYRINGETLEVTAIVDARQDRRLD